MNSQNSRNNAAFSVARDLLLGRNPLLNPHIIKALAICACAVIILPFMAVSALPNILFGFDTATADDVKEMTERASDIEGIYNSFEICENQAVSELVFEEQRKYEDCFDETETVTEKGNISLNSFIAISSVYHNQDLFSMSEESLVKLAKQKFEVSSKIECRANGDEIIRVLIITLKERTPDEFMKALKFDKKQRDWAQAILSSMEDLQEIPSDNEDYILSAGKNFGDIVFTDGLIPTVYYNQADARWGNKKYGKSGTIASSACGPAAVAVAVSSLKGESSITPDVCAEWAEKNGYRIEGSGSLHKLIPDAAAHFGLECEALGSDINKVTEELKKGRLVIAIMSKGHFTKGGHFIVLRGITDSGKILTADTISLARSKKEWSAKLIAGEANRNAAAGGPFWSVWDGDDV